MAGFNEILVGRFNRMLQKLLSMKGPAVMNELAPTLQPAINVFYGAENRYLEQWSRFALNVDVTGAAGNTAGIKFRNPKAVNLLVAFEKVVWNPTATDTVIIGYSTNDITDFTTATDSSLTQNLDAREGKVNSGMIISHQNTTPLATTTIFKAQGIPNTVIDLLFFDDQEICLAPGASIMFANAVNAGFLRINAIWRERFLEDSERM